MDILAHTLWTNAAARGANKIAKKKNGGFTIHVGWAAFWGVFPDFFAFTAPMVIAIYQVLLKDQKFSEIISQRMSGNFDLAAYLYQYSHSLIVFAVVFVIFWIIFKRPRYELLGWALHILIDIPSHSIDFYPTPFLFPISSYRFPYGISWSNKYFMVINYFALVVVWGRILYSKNKKKHSKNIPS